MADTISILVATDNHVGAHERDAVRGDDSWKTFHEIMCLAKDRDVDMVLLAGDLFHENKPSRKSMYNVMRSLRFNCLGDKPCELQMLSDESEHFDATFDHVNYEDANINVGIPVFTIHGNHDDPTGEGHYSALDVLSVSGLVNYFGKAHQSDHITVKPVLIQKGSTKLALYGISNVRDERIHRTFRSGDVKFHRPSTQMTDWYNVICLHQNHHARTDTSYLPENFLPNFLDLVIWGHEHECEIDPRENAEMNFKVMQPGSSIATSLIPGEAVPKHVAILTITGRDLHCEKIRLKTVRPFVYKDLVLANDKEAVKIAKAKDDHRTELTRHLINVVEGMIEEAKKEWQEAQDEREHEDEEPEEPPLPLVRLRVETTSFDGIGRFDIENPQRFSNRFVDKVANTNDVVQFHVKKKNLAARAARDAEADRQIMSKFQELETIQVSELVQEFLQAQALTILPQNYFGDAVNQYVVKDDKHAMELFVNESLAEQIKHLVRLQADANDGMDDEDLGTQINEQRARMEELFAKGLLKVAKTKARFKPKPPDWESDVQGPWEEQPAALMRASEDLDSVNGEDEEDSTPAPRTAARGRGRGRGSRAGTTATASSGRKAATASTKKTTAASSSARGRKRAISDDDDDDDEDDAEEIIMDDDDDEEGEGDSQAMFFPEKRKTSSSTRGRTTRGRTAAAAASSSTRGGRHAAAASPPASTTRKAPARGATATATARAKQSTLNFTTSQKSVLGSAGRGGGTRSQSYEIDDDDDDDDDAFEAAPPARRGRR